jgi:hypothetical protein
MQQVSYNPSQGQFVSAQAQTVSPIISQQVPQAQQGEFFNAFGQAPANQSDDNVPF